LFFAATFVAGTVGTGFFAVLGGEQPSADAPAQRSPDSARIEAYCGVICLARAASALGKQVDFADLLKPQYVGSTRGSSIGELARAAEDLGLYTEPMSRMTCGMLRQARCPVILHVKPALGAADYTHWVLFMGMEEGKARIYDQTKPVRLVQFEELAASWDGVALLVSTSPIGRSRMLLEACLAFAIYSSMGLLAVVLIHKCEHCRPERFPGFSWRRA
jgi:ABC-type bacteriocin/lantibiotic exporter with double-glycine peptidase domain